MPDFEGRTILIGVSGGISAYKVVELARLLVKRGANVKVVMTSAGEKFVTPLTFRSITGNPVATSLWSDPSSPIPHISLSDEADLIVVAPATADIIARYARGIADDLLSTTLLAARGTVLVAPAMNTRMFLNPVTSENIELLRSRGVIIIEPGEGGLACGEEGPGRMAEPSDILLAIEGEIDRVADLKGRRILVTAGPTREYMDPVRFISNPSTGKMGYAIADRAARRGAEVLLVSGPTGLPCPAGVDILRIESASDMKQAVLDNIEGKDALVMTAAVGDFKPTVVAGEKLKKSDGVPEMKLEPTEDILGMVAGSRGGMKVVGFAAETENVVENSRKKLSGKNLDLIVANKVNEPGSGFGSDTDLAAVLAPGDEDIDLRIYSKRELADAVLDRLSDLFD